MHKRRQSFSYKKSSNSVENKNHFFGRFEIGGNGNKVGFEIGGNGSVSDPLVILFFATSGSKKSGGNAKSRKFRFQVDDDEFYHLAAFTSFRLIGRKKIPTTVSVFLLFRFEK